MGEDPKPHRNFQEQLALLRARGLDVGEHKSAVAALKRIGYYRLSGYLYPLRRELSADPDDASIKSRSDDFVDGASLAATLELHDFDRKLRSILFEALQVLEVGLAVHVGYSLGKRHPTGHLTRDHLDPSSCSRPASKPKPNVVDVHDEWLARFKSLLADSKGEDFVKHHQSKYNGQLPIWVATEIMDFGSLVRLYSLLDPKDRELIGHTLGLKKVCSTTLHAWLRSLNILRNHCAHNNRVWNRTFPYPPPKPSLVVIESKLHHINNIDEEARQKLYHLAAFIAYLIVKVDPATNWPLRFRTEIKKFKPVNGMTPENTMGFPEGWSEFELWKYDPKALPRTVTKASQGLAS